MSIDEAGALRHVNGFPVLGLLLPPPTSSQPAATSLPVIDGHASRHHAGVGEDLSSSVVDLLNIPRPLRRRVLRHPLQDPRCLPWPSPILKRLGSLLSDPHGPVLSRRCRLRFMLRTAQLPRPHRRVVVPLRRQPLNQRREPRYQGPWHLPGPDSHRPADNSFTLGHHNIRNLPSIETSEHLDALSIQVGPPLSARGLVGWVGVG